MESADPVRDTIAAIATPAGRGGIGVIRVSGSHVPAIARALIGGLPAARQVKSVAIRDSLGAQIESGLAIYFAGPASYTGEDVLEIQGHGSPAALGAVLAACVEAGARLAEPGEFTRRAFLNGKLDLAQAEAVADLIEAATAKAARGALRSLTGEFSAAIHELLRQLTDLRALIEAMLDFPEEEVGDVDRQDLRRRLADLGQALGAVLKSSRQGSLLRSGIHVVLAGRPNVGKSSLLNCLAGAERAIVTAVPGTTRDAIKDTVSIDGVPLNIIDTAGLRDATDEVERIGIERTWKELGRADLVVMMLDATCGMTPEDQAILTRFPAEAKRILVWNKIDMTHLAPGRRADKPDEVWISAKTGAGFEALRALLLEAAGWDLSGESIFVARERHLRALNEVAKRVEAAAEQMRQWEFLAEELRLAQQALESITGEFTADDLLGEIFSRFCLGK